MWYKVNDVKLNDNIIKYYIWPKDRIICFTNEGGDLFMIPTFDIRQTGIPIDMEIDNAIKTFKDSIKNKLDISNTTIYCSVVQYENNDEQVGIVCDVKPHFPATNFAPVDCVKKLEANMRDSSRRAANKETYCDNYDKQVPYQSFTELDILTKVKEFKDKINANQHLVDNMKKFFKG